MNVTALPPTPTTFGAVTVSDGSVVSSAKAADAPAKASPGAIRAETAPIAKVWRSFIGPLGNKEDMELNVEMTHEDAED